ncbi:MAG: hypothetical protein WC538_22165 [Thermoanaerobaculia bacterium]
MKKTCFKIWEILQDETNDGGHGPGWGKVVAFTVRFYEGDMVDMTRTLPDGSTETVSQFNYERRLKMNELGHLKSKKKKDDSELLPLESRNDAVVYGESDFGLLYAPLGNAEPYIREFLKSELKKDTSRPPIVEQTI